MGLMGKGGLLLISAMGIALKWVFLEWVRGLVVLLIYTAEPETTEHT